MACSILAPKLTWDPKLCQICWWNINNNNSFHYRLFPRKTNMTKFFKISQKRYFGPLCPNLGKKWILLEKGLHSFINNQITYHCAKNQKNFNESFLRKMMEGHTKNQFISLISLWDFRVLWLKNPTIWLAKSILGHISSTRIDQTDKKRSEKKQLSYTFK